MNFFEKVRVFKDYFGGSIENNTYSTDPKTFSIRFKSPLIHNHCKTEKKYVKLQKSAPPFCFDNNTFYDVFLL